MSRRALGASVFLDSFRKRQLLRETLSRLKEHGGAVRLGFILDALDIDDPAFRSDLLELEAAEFEVVVRSAGRT